MEEKNIQQEPQVSLSADKLQVATDETELPAEQEEKIEAIHHWIDDIFGKEQNRLQLDGISEPEIWVRGMAAIDRALSQHPLETLQYLAEVYGVTFSQGNDNQLPAEVITKLQNLEQNQQILWQALQLQDEQTKQLAIGSFVNAKDDEGRLLHPYFSEVKDEMFALLRGGAAADFETAYDKALWLNPQTRDYLLEKQTSQNLQHLAEEAEKAKSAGFSPSGKLGKEDYSNMTTREILERKFKELAD